MRRAIAVALFVASTASAAKAPLAYPRTFYWRGGSADRIAALFGMPADRDSTLRLRLHEDLYAMSHPTDLRMMDPEKRKNAPPVYVTLHFTPGRPHQLAMEGTFYDGGTAIPEIRPRFFFTSVFFRDGQPVPEGWANAFRRVSATIDRTQWPAAESRAGAPVRDVALQVITSSDSSGAPGVILRVTIAD